MRDPARNLAKAKTIAITKNPQSCDWGFFYV